LLPDWTARLDEAATAEDAAKWIAAIGGQKPAGYVPDKTTRGELLHHLYRELPVGQDYGRTENGSQKSEEEQIAIFILTTGS